LIDKWSGWQVIYDNQWANEFKTIVRKRIPYSASIAEETMEEVRQELAIKLNELDSAPNVISAYLRTAFRNTLEDYLRKKEGYPRPPEWVKRLGSAYEKIYKLLCLENRAVNDVHAIMASLYNSTREFVEQIISEIRAGVTNCGAWRETVTLEDAASEVDEKNLHSSNRQLPEDILAEMDVDAVINTILGQPVSNSTGAFSKALNIFRRCELNEDERLLLRLVYTDGRSVSQSARLLKIPDAGARKLLRNVLQRLNKALNDAGILIL